MTTAVCERPILFSGPMVRAILEGRKTQTRRVVQWRSSRADTVDDGNQVVQTSEHGWWPYYVYDGDEIPLRSPYGQPGDRLWVREAWATEYHLDDKSPGSFGPRVKLWYGADGASGYGREPGAEPIEWLTSNECGRSRASLHMPRWASRLSLDVVGVRVERLQEIPWRDALSEGIEGDWCCEGFSPVTGDGCGCQGMPVNDPRLDFRELWDKLNAKRGHGWESNPWVWVVEFRRCA